MLPACTCAQHVMLFPKPFLNTSIRHRQKEQTTPNTAWWAGAKLDPHQRGCVQGLLDGPSILQPYSKQYVTIPSNGKGPAAGRLPAATSIGNNSPPPSPPPSPAELLFAHLTAAKLSNGKLEFR